MVVVEFVVYAVLLLFLVVVLVLVVTSFECCVLGLWCGMLLMDFVGVWGCLRCFVESFHFWFYFRVRF